MTHANRLANETSPYLLQHARNPVDWYPWGEEAFARARAEQKPVFLSIGYSACHWCHVMERESFENEEIASVLNAEFVSIKVDREERPDIDSIYMQAVQMMTGQGGWPMSMFLTPAAVPFFGGTYFPPEDRYGRPGFKHILTEIAGAWRERRNEVEAASIEIRETLASPLKTSPRAEMLSFGSLESAARSIVAQYDARNGGFGGAPKFPQAMALEFLMQLAARGSDSYREIVLSTLTRMARGGIYDQVGGGFHRYSVDAQWLVPHFEKMLYDNALLARLYVHAWQWTKDPFFAAVVRETLGFVEREMTSPEGGFYSTLDADSEGEEGKFYVWTREEVMSILGEEDGRRFCALYDVTSRGNWEGRTILNVPRDPAVVADDLGVPLPMVEDVSLRGKCKLYGARESRVRPGRDEKILAGWNGWMLAAFSEAALATGDDRYVALVRRNAEFLTNRMIDGDRLFRSYKEGLRKIGGLLEDYAGVAWGLVVAFEATQTSEYLRTARSLMQYVLAHFADSDGTFFDTPDDHEPLITRPKDLFDNATPSGNSLAIASLQKLALYYADETMERAARAALEAIMPIAEKYPAGFGFLLSDAVWAVTTPKEIAITGNSADEMRGQLFRAAGETYVPNRALATSDAPDLPLMAGKPGDVALAYVCEHYACKEPTNDPERLRELLK